MKEISGGVTAPQGFRAAGMHCGIRANHDKKDIALIASDCLCAAAGVYTKNLVKAAPVYKTMANLANGRAAAIICNSGNANACAPRGADNANSTCLAVGAALGINPDDVIVASTGVIGQELNMEPILKSLLPLTAALSTTGGGEAAEAIMTTDTVKKEIALEFELDGKTCRMGAMAKGSGMIHPNMGTMLCFITTDAAVAPAALQRALSAAVKKTFNRVTVDGDTSTNDMAVCLANGMAGNTEVVGDSAELSAALLTVCTHLARAIAADGEGATKLLECTVRGAESESVAEMLAKSVVGSSLVKAAMYGSDANWGRVMCAMGYSGAPFDPATATLSFESAAGSVTVYSGGEALEFSEEKATNILSQKEVAIVVSLRAGSGEATCWGCDLTYDYVRINGDYRS
ncbi:MAG: bifunctional glutamate N-acetyltransferase/amino-acid acetyltransferase ArgJ [Oscillospiraceae bacterium]|nr:bifunctional glutamate N-acetyltransferase/amino-acid acetyltransferase ArgJ [Oscillospiraceae bacterium]